MKNDETERMEVQQNSEEEAAGQSERPSISPAVIHRLPRYYRYLRELLTQGRTRISSGELAGMMRVTASQIRQATSIASADSVSRGTATMSTTCTHGSVICSASGADFMPSLSVRAISDGRWCICPCLKSAGWTSSVCLTRERE